MKKENKETQVFTDKEIDILLSSAILGGATNEECQKFIDWAILTRVNYAVLYEVLTGRNIVSIIEDGSPVYLAKRKNNK